MTDPQYISIDNLTLLWPGKTYAAIKKMIQRGKIKDVLWLTKQEAIKEGLQWKEGGGGGKNGKRPFISIDNPAIPQGVKLKYVKSSLNIDSIENNKITPVSDGNAAPFLPESAHSCCPVIPKRAPGLLSTQGQGFDDFSLAPPFSPAISEKSKQIAKARYDLLKMWGEYREKNRAQSKKKTDDEFLLAYNSGVLFPQLFEILNEVSVKTLYRWKSEIGDTKDWTKLIPRPDCRCDGIPQLDKEESNIFLNLLLKPNKIKIGTACRLVKYALEKRGIQSEKSEKTFRRYAEWFQKKHYDAWVLMREGQKALRDKVEPFIGRDPSVLNVGDVLVADGHRLNFQVLNPFNGKPCRATLVGYVDWKSYDLCGYEIMIEENTQCIASAMRNSILRLGKYPTVSYQDNGKAFRARFFTDSVNFEECGLNGLFGRLNIVPVFARPYNARAKIIERWFKEFSDTCERLIPSFTGSSITDQPAWMKRNEKFHKAIHNEYVPTIEESITIIEAWLEFHRSQPCPHVKGRTIGEVFNDGKGAGINTSYLDELMMDIKIKNIQRNGIRFLGADYCHDYLYGLRDQVTIKYSLFDLSSIKVYSMQGEFFCTAERTMLVHPMARILGNVKDIEDVKRGIAHQRRLERQTIKLSREYMRANGNVPQLDWQKVAETTPGAIEKIAHANIPLPGVERRIPDECLDRGFSPVSSELNTDKEEVQQEIFHEAWQRYEYLIEQVELSEEEKLWIKDYINTREYSSIYERDLPAGIFFISSWEKYEYLCSQDEPLTRGQQWWINAYEAGTIFPGEYKEGCRIHNFKKAVGGSK